MESAEVLIVGAGIAGLAHAWQAARRGRRVTIVERSAQAQGASIRNFGMIWVIGQATADLPAAMKSREMWLELAQHAGLWARPVGSLHLAKTAEETAVLEEFNCLATSRGYQCRLITPGQLRKISSSAKSEGLHAALLSDTEINIEPRQAISTIPRWLQERFGTVLEFGTLITHLEPGKAYASDGRSWRFDRAIVCGGADIQALYPDLLSRHGAQRVKLQMLAASQPSGWDLGPMIAGGLTLQHYPAFADCPSLPLLKRRIAADRAEYNTHGIHVMLSQNAAGEAVIGDSHHYGDDVTPFDSAEVERLILDYARQLFELPHWQVTRRWHGVYAKHPRLPLVHESPFPGVDIIAATGGTGMTMSFGLAEKLWRKWDGK